MTIKNKKPNNQNPYNFNQDRFKEVTKILALGIIRLSMRERSQNPHLINQLLLDHKNFPSTHSDNINSINQVSHTL